MPVGDVDSDAKGSGARFNDGKPAFDLVPLVALEDCAKVFEYGRRKYASWNWAKGFSVWSDSGPAQLQMKPSMAPSVSVTSGPKP